MFDERERALNVSGLAIRDIITNYSIIAKIAKIEMLLLLLLYYYYGII